MQTEGMVIDRHGGPEVLERKSYDLPDPGVRQVRIRVRAVALNHLDLWVRRGGPAFKLDYPHRLGSDVAGEVEALGDGARGVEVGAKVMVHPAVSCGHCPACVAGRDNLCRSYHILGENTQGGYARHINVPDVNVLPIGDALGFEQAAALPLCTLTAWQMVFRKADVKPGQTVLVNAAGSGVSTMIIQMCKLIGATVIASTTNAAKVEPARELGADEVVLSSEQDLAKTVKVLTGRVGADVVFDHVGGELFEKSLAAVRWGGRVVTCGATAGFKPAIDLRAIFFRQLEILGSTMGRLSDLREALPMMLAGRLRSVVDRVMPLCEARAAHEALEGRQVFGKLVLSVD
ncbi:MAG: zinc-binding dehydrogenase [Deltaproteobacteria bacterium]|jgi:NADPH:quinone reductase-like Zn-dependent oxidoreductase|nr:zinc-binding dehydrogenase [Deltaproteobacteria bacterium]MBW2529894.1 zinc-binding dehydrogenase [Deltaproteobacteria bacterium]